MGEGIRFSVFLNKNDDETLLKQTKNEPNKFTLIPVGRVKYEIKYENSGLKRVKYNTTGERHHFQRTLKCFVLGEDKEWKLKEI